jgi:DNA-binding MarR family transcriptional regulator
MLIMSVDIPDESMPFLLMASFRGLVDALHRRLEDKGFIGLTATHGFAMQALGAGCTSSELAQRLGVSKQAGAKTVVALERLALVERSINPDDARERIVTPTIHGRRMLEESGNILKHLIGDWRATVGDHNVNATLHTLLSVDHGSRSMNDLSDWPVG